MHKYLIGAVAVAAVAMTATAVPAFTASSGTVAVSVTAQAPAAPCLSVTPDSVDFGTQPFSTDNGSGLKQRDSNITVNFCGTAAGQNLLASVTPATGPSGSWTTSGLNPSLQPCPSPNVFYLELFGFTTPSMALTGAAAPVLGSGGGSAVFPPGDKVFRLTLTMPCQGSNGSGETKTLSATFTAVVAS